MENNFDSNLVTKEMLAKAMSCETPEEIIAMAKEAGVELTAEEAKKFLKNWKT